MDRRLDIALIQTRTPATAEAGLAHVEPLIRQAAAGGARFILTPEGTNLLEQRRDRRRRTTRTTDYAARFLCPSAANPASPESSSHAAAGSGTGVIEKSRTSCRLCAPPVAAVKPKRMLSPKS